ncbi:Exopolygalacturonase [Thalictrum thalictroides]|uniref:Exopolygalacturonase n=1 Tax=Thalictrum thalictroides TaxID=46969 RepID=A0A7J6V6C0_THATH|nr:Exopolygalacturonase [Thalictrum thalictroides]
MKVEIILIICINAFSIGVKSQIEQETTDNPQQLSTGADSSQTFFIDNPVQLSTGADSSQTFFTEANSVGQGNAAIFEQQLSAVKTQATGTGTCSGGTYNVKDFGAKGDGKTDDCKAIQAAWLAACKCTGSPKVLIPSGTYLTGPVQFFGACKGTTITLQVQGTLKASTNLGHFGQRDWICFGWVRGLILTGGGTFDGQGTASWPYNKCPVTKKCNVLPTNLKFNAMTDTTVKGITSLNSKFFHIGVVNCQKFNVIGVHITAPGDSPNTDGLHFERSSDVTITDSIIATGDDCISIGHGNSRMTIKGITCGPGHGISVGSLGRYQNEGDVNGLLVKNCTLSKTTNGVRLKTWESSPNPSKAINITFEDIIMNNVCNPIIIDQTYCPYVSCESKLPSKVKLQDIFFRRIRGTSSTPIAVWLKCNKNIPCQNVVLQDINLSHPAGAKSTCQNIQAKTLGTVIPTPCKG